MDQAGGGVGGRGWVASRISRGDVRRRDPPQGGAASGCPATRAISRCSPAAEGSRSLPPNSTSRLAGSRSGVGSDALLSFRFSNQSGIAHLSFPQTLQKQSDVTTVLSDDLLLDPANFTDHRIRYPFGCRVGINCLHLQADLRVCKLQAAFRPTRQPSPAGGGGS